MRKDGYLNHLLSFIPKQLFNTGICQTLNFTKNKGADKISFEYTIQTSHTTSDIVQNDHLTSYLINARKEPTNATIENKLNNPKSTILGATASAYSCLGASKRGSWFKSSGS